MRHALTALLLSCALLGAGEAQTPNAAQQRAPTDARHAYAIGAFLAAADAGEAQANEAGLSIAAQSLLALCVSDLRGPQSAAWLDRAQRDAEAAMTRAPESVDARLQLAVALGMKGRRASLGEALKQNYAPRGKTLIEQALAMAPDDARAQALLGGWNLEIVRRGGALGARMLGASSRAGILAFDRARDLAPDNSAIALHYAVALLGLDPKRYGAKADELLQAAALAAPRDAFETAMREEARRLAAVLAARGAEAAAQSAAAAFL